MRLDMKVDEFGALFEDVFQGPSKEDMENRGLDAEGHKLPDEIIISDDGETKYSLHDIQEVEILYWHDLTPEEQEELDYIDDQEGSFFRYNDQIFDLGNFIRTQPQDTLNAAGWNGVETAGYSNGWIVKLEDGGDGLTVARISWSEVL